MERRGLRLCRLHPNGRSPAVCRTVAVSCVRFHQRFGRNDDGADDRRNEDVAPCDARGRQRRPSRPNARQQEEHRIFRQKASPRLMPSTTASATERLRVQTRKTPRARSETKKICTVSVETSTDDSETAGSVTKVTPTQGAVSVRAAGASRASGQARLPVKERRRKPDPEGVV